MQRVVSTLLPSSTGGVSRSTMVTLVEGWRRAMANAVDRPKTPAPTMMTDSGDEGIVPGLISLHVTLGCLSRRRYRASYQGLYGYQTWRREPTPRTSRYPGTINYLHNRKPTSRYQRHIPPLITWEFALSGCGHETPHVPHLKRYTARLSIDLHESRLFPLVDPPIGSLVERYTPLAIASD